MNNKNSIIGFALIGIILFGFSWYQSKQYEKQAELQALNNKNQPSLVEDQTHTTEILITEEEKENAPLSYKDSLITAAQTAMASLHTLSNDKLDIVFTTKGAQLYSVKINDYKNYDSTDLYLIKPEMSDFGLSLYVGENINTKDFVFDIVESTDSTISMRLPFSNGGYIQQKYYLMKGSYHVKNELSFINMENIIPRKVSMMDMDWNVTIPRIEKGYKNEVQYSKLNYLFPGEEKPEVVGKGKNGAETVNAHISWFAFQQQFFSAIMRAENDFTYGNFKVKYFQEDDKNKNLMTCSAEMSTNLDVNSSSLVLPFDYYFGPNHYRTLKSYGNNYERIIPLGSWIVNWISRILIIPSFNFLGRFIGNYGIIILLLTLFIKLLLSPLTVKSYLSSAKMNVLKPEIAKINERYPKQEDAMKKQQATMNLYKRAGVSPMGGCLPMLIQFPILFAMFRFFPASIELRQASFLWAEDLSAYDSIVNLPFNIPLYGDHVSLFALLMAVSMFFYSKMNSSQMSDDPNMAGMKIMSIYFMPIMMLFICNNLSSGLSYYYLLSNLITMVQTWATRKFFVDEEKIYARLKESEGKPMPKSKWQLRLEEAQKMQQAQAKKRK